MCGNTILYIALPNGVREAIKVLQTLACVLTHNYFITDIMSLHRL